MTLEELKLCELNILKEIKKFCDQNGLRYFLAGGTLLGAVRHKGFIPWDDDIDVCMPRSDYEKLQATFNKNNDRYKFVSMENDDDYCYLWGKVVDTQTTITERFCSQTKGAGVYVDIFIVDDGGNDYKNVVKQLNKAKKIRQTLQMAKVTRKKKPFINRIKAVRYDLVYAFRKCYYKKQKRISTKYAGKDSKYAVCFTAIYGEKEIYNKEIFRDAVKLKFEDEYFDVPIGYDKYLTQLYGDYMTPPPKDKQISNHAFLAYYKNID